MLNDCRRKKSPPDLRSMQRIFGTAQRRRSQIAMHKEIISHRKITAITSSLTENARQSEVAGTAEIPCAVQICDLRSYKTRIFDDSISTGLSSCVLSATFASLLACNYLKWAETLNLSADYLSLSRIFVNKKVFSRNTSIKAVSTCQISSLCCLPALSFSPLSFSSSPVDWHPYFSELPRGCLPVSRGLSLITEALSSSQRKVSSWGSPVYSIEMENWVNNLLIFLPWIDRQTEKVGREPGFAFLSTRSVISSTEE